MFSILLLKMQLTFLLIYELKMLKLPDEVIHFSKPILDACLMNVKKCHKLWFKMTFWCINPWRYKEIQTFYTHARVVTQHKYAQWGKTKTWRHFCDGKYQNPGVITFPIYCKSTTIIMSTLDIFRPTSHVSLDSIQSNEDHLCV